MAESDKLEILEKKSEEKPARWKSAVSVVAVLIIAFFIVRWLIAMLIPVLIGIILIANRDLVFKAIRLIYKQYKDETYKGLLATLGAVLLFFPFVGFCFLRSIYYMFFDEKKEEKKEKAEDSMTSKFIDLAVKEKVKDILGVDEEEKDRQR